MPFVRLHIIQRSRLIALPTCLPLTTSAARIIIWTSDKRHFTMPSLLLPSQLATEGHCLCRRHSSNSSYCPPHLLFVVEMLLKHCSSKRRRLHSTRLFVGTLRTVHSTGRCWWMRWERPRTWCYQQFFTFQRLINSVLAWLIVLLWATTIWFAVHRWGQSCVKLMLIQSGPFRQLICFTLCSHKATLDLL